MDNVKNSPVCIQRLRQRKTEYVHKPFCCERTYNSGQPRAMHLTFQSLNIPVLPHHVSSSRHFHFQWVIQQQSHSIYLCLLHTYPLCVGNLVKNPPLIRLLVQICTLYETAQQPSHSVFFFTQCNFTRLNHQPSHSISQSSFGVSTLCGSSSNHATPFIFFFRHFNFMGLLYQPSLSTYLCIPIVPLPQFPHTSFSPVHHLS